MISKEDFNKVWKDSTREVILNQYYYDFIELERVFTIIKEAREFIKNYNKVIRDNKMLGEYANFMIIPKELLEILDKVEENK